MYKIVAVLTLFLGLIACNSVEPKSESHQEENVNLEIVDTTKVAVEKKDTLRSLLGHSFEFELNAEDIEASLEFYKIIGFELINSDKDKKNGINYRLCDGSVNITLLNNQTMKFYQSINIIRSESFKELDNLSNALDIRDRINFQPLSKIYRIELQGSELNLGILLGDKNKFYTMGAIFDNLDFATLKFPNPVLGVFGEYAIAVDSVENEMEFYKKLGFKTHGIMGGPEKYTIMYDGVFPIGLHKTNQWTGAHITYFGSDTENQAKILKEKGVNIKPFMVEGKSLPKNYILTDPMGNEIFMFSIN